MFTKKLLSALFLGVVLFSSCKKDDAPAPTGLTIGPDGSVQMGSDAKGAMYAVYTKTFDDNSGAGFFESQNSYAWYENQTTSADAGIVTCGLEELTNFGWYMNLSMGDDLFDYPNPSVSWDVAGTASVAAFAHTDVTPFSAEPSFILPSTININNTYTINHGAPGAVDAVVYTVIGNKGTVHKANMGNSSSVTFTVAELNQAAFTGDLIGFSVMPVKLSNATYNGKKYYFVKQLQYQRETATL